jgi:hypothetical protein
MTDSSEHTWNQAARRDVRAALTSATFDATSRTVTVPARWTPPDESLITFRSLKDLFAALVELAEQRIVVQIPFEDGQPALPVGGDAIVGDLIAQHEVDLDRFFRGV